MSQSQPNLFGSQLRKLRRERGLTLQQAADAAGVGRVTVNRWETGAQRPRPVEWKALLTALEATPQQRRRLETLLDTAWAEATRRHALIHYSDQHQLGAISHGGDLLRAMRLRHNLTLDAAAHRIGVSEWTLRRWEKGTVVPSVTQIHEVCYALHAEEEELTALTCGTLRFAGGQAQIEPLLSADALEDRLDKTQMRIWYGEQKLIELEALHLKRQAWALAARQPDKRHLLSYAWHVHSNLYSIHERFEEAARLAQEGMELLPDKNYLPNYVLYMAVDVANGFAYRRTRPNPRRGVEFLRSWLGVDRHPHLVTWLRSEMAEMLAKAGDAEAAVAMSKEACELATNFSPKEQARRAGAHAEILLHSAHRPADALKALPPYSSRDTPIFNAEVGILHTEILAALGENSDAFLRLQEVRNLMDTYHLSELLPRIEAVQQRL